MHRPQAFLGAHFGYRQALISSQLRSSVTAAVFRKALAVNAATLAAAGSGRVQVRAALVECGAAVQPCVLCHRGVWEKTADVCKRLPPSRRRRLCR